MKNCRIWIAITGMLLLLATNQAAGQKEVQENDANLVSTQQLQEDLFKLNDSIVNDLEDRLDEDKFVQLNELKNKEFSKASLTEALQAAGLSMEEIDTVLNILQEDRKLAEAVKAAAPVALAIDKTETEIKAQEELLEKTQIDEERKKISESIQHQRRQLKKNEHQISQAMEGFDGTNKERIASALQDTEYKGNDIEIISNRLLHEALFSRKILTLSKMTESIEAIAKEIESAEQSRKNAKSEEEKKSISEYIAELNKRMENSENDFSLLTTGIDSANFLKKEGKEVDWNKELKEIFSPIIVELKETTERPRKMEQLRSDIAFLEKRIPQVQLASKELDKFIEKAEDGKVKERLGKWKNHWEQLEKEFSTQYDANKNQLLQLENDRKSLLTSFKVFFDSFVKHRGRSLFFALLAFVSIYLFFRLLQRILWKISPIHKSPKYIFWANLMDVIFYVLTFLVATGALVAVLFTSGDWLILAIVLLLILGVIWGARNTLPHFIEQIKLLLGFGAVRQGEAVVIDGILYRVEMMGVYSYLKNPLLTGGTLRLPLKDLVGTRSRPYDEDTVIWFPCKAGDVVLIDGSDMRKVLMITPQYVKLDWYGCEMDEYMPTNVFMNKTLLSLTKPFWAGITFRLSYSHRDYQEIVDKLTQFVREEIKKLSYAEHIADPPCIELGSLEQKSMNFMVSIQAAPEIAIKYGEIKRIITQICLRAANNYGWDIIQYDHKIDGAQKYKPLLLQQDDAENHLKPILDV